MSRLRRHSQERLALRAGDPAEVCRDELKQGQWTSPGPAGGETGAAGVAGAQGQRASDRANEVRNFAMSSPWLLLRKNIVEFLQVRLEHRGVFRGRLGATLLHVLV